MTPIVTLLLASILAAPPAALSGRLYAVGDRGDEHLAGAFSVDLANPIDVRLFDAKAVHGRVSPNGKTLAYTRSGAGGGQLLVCGTDGESPPVLLLDQGANMPPCWEPDNAHIIITAPRVPRTLGIAAWRFDADGSGRAELPIPQTENVFDVSPDGRWLLTRSRKPREGVTPTDYLPLPPKPRAGQKTAPGPRSDWFLALIHPDGTGHRFLAPHPDGPADDADPPVAFSTWEPRFSPDGARIVFTRFLQMKSGRRALSLWFMDADGTHRRKAFDFPEGTRSAEAVWSPDGRRLAVSTVDRDGGRITVMDLDGGGRRAVHLPTSGPLNVLDWR